MTTLTLDDLTSREYQARIANECLARWKAGEPQSYVTLRKAMDTVRAQILEEKAMLERLKFVPPAPK